MTDINCAVAFVKEHGGPVEQARLRHLLTGADPHPNIIAALWAGQLPSGGCPPPWAPTAAGIDATCFRLAQAEQLGIGPDVPAVQRAVAFLAGQQRSDGTWEESPDLSAMAPPWARPGDPAAQLYLTANAGYWLAIHGSEPGAGRAAGFLITQLGPDGRLPSYLHAHWLTAALLWRLGRGAAAEPLLAFLAGPVAAGMNPGNLAWMLSSLLGAGLPAAHPLAAAAAAALDGGQGPDGRWPSADGPDSDPHTTLEALRALQLTGGW